MLFELEVEETLVRLPWDMFMLIEKLLLFNSFICVAMLKSLARSEFELQSLFADNFLIKLEFVSILKTSEFESFSFES